jgi:hypothetical protein
MFEFTLNNSFKQVIPCDDWMYAYRVRLELLKAKSIWKVDFERVK